MRELVNETVQRGDRFFRWRGGSVSRLEGIFDAVMALAITLVMFSMEVPDSFDELLSAFRKLPAFAVCFAILILCWYYHFLFHRRFGLEDSVTMTLNSILMFLIVFYVYPPKFVYLKLFDPQGAGFPLTQLSTLMILFSVGFLAIFFLLGLMYLYAFFKRQALRLDPNETILTKMKIGECVGYASVAGLSIAIANFPSLVGWSGLIYFSIPAVQFLNGWYWGSKIKE